MKNKILWGVSVIALVLAIIGLINRSVNAGAAVPSGTGNGYTNLTSLGLSGDLYVAGNALFAGSVTSGGGITSTSTSGSVVPLTVSDFDTESVVDVTLNVQDSTLSFPASSTWTTLLTAGQSKAIFVRNASTTAAMDLTISGGTGVLLKKATSSAVVYGDADGANFAKIILTRKANTDIEALLTIFMD